MFSKYIDTKFIKISQIDTSIDNYYENPYKFNITNYNNLINVDINDTHNNLNYIVKSLTSIIMTNSNNTLNQNDNFKKFDNTLFKLIASNKINEFQKIIKFHDCNQQDQDGDTPMHIAMFLCNYEAIKILIDNNADLFIKDKWGQISTHRICFCLDDDNLLKIIDLILIKQCEYNLNVFNIQDNLGNTPFHLILKYIIKNNIKINLKHRTIFLKLTKITNNDIKNKFNETILTLLSFL